MQKLQKAIRRSKIGSSPDHKTTKREKPKKGKNMQNKKETERDINGRKDQIEEPIKRKKEEKKGSYTCEGKEIW